MALRSLQVMEDFTQTQRALQQATSADERYAMRNQIDTHIQAALDCHRDPEWVSGPFKPRDHAACARMHVEPGESILGYVAVHHERHEGKEAREKEARAQESQKGRLSAAERDAAEADALPNECDACGAAASFVTCHRTASRSCTRCGAVHKWQCPMATSLDLLWSDSSIAKHSGYSYKQSNHMWSWILRIQGKETVDIPPELLDRLMAEFRKTGVTRATVTPAKIRQGLKNLKAPRYYNHVHTLQHMLFGVLPPQMTDEQERSIMAMFNDIIVVYARLKKRSNMRRVNMLSYSYILRKIMEMLGYDEFLGQLVMLKHRDRLQEQERIWGLICDEIPEFHFTYTC